MVFNLKRDLLSVYKIGLGGSFEYIVSNNLLLRFVDHNLQGRVLLLIRNIADQLQVWNLIEE